MTHIVENVRFRLADGVSAEAFLEANKAVAAWLSARAGFVARTLSEGPDGQWPDHVEWTDMASARAASEAMMSEENLAPFGMAIAAGSIEMRHDRLRWKG